jgi:hypothetical protein
VRIKMKEDGRMRKGRAMVGIALAAITLAFLAALVPSVSAQEPLPPGSYNGLCNYITLNATGLPNPAAVLVLIGQDVWFLATPRATNISVTIRGDPTSSATAGYIYTTDALGRFDTSVMTVQGVYYVNSTGGSSTTPLDRWDAMLAVVNPVMSLDLKVAGTSVSIITAGTTLEVGFTNNLDAKDMVSLVITDPDGNTLTSKNGQNFSYINVSYLTSQYSVGAGINTSGWEIGDYTFKVQTKQIVGKNIGARGLDMSSNEKPLTILTGLINIEADKTSVIELASVKLTVTGRAGNGIQISTSDPAHTIFPGGMYDNPAVDTYTGFTRVIDADGMRIFTVKFNATGSYTITVTDLTAAGTPTDTVDITVSRRGVIFDVPSAVVIGERFMIKGRANTGSFVTIAVDDHVYPELDRLVIGPTGEFEKEINTSKPGIPPFTVPGCVRLRAFIDRPAIDTDTGDETDDGSVMISVLETHLNATLSKAAVYLGDSFEVYGNASSDHVGIVTISPKGGGGKGMDGLYGTSVYTVPTFCNFTNYNFYKKIKVDSEADTGNYTIMVLSPDRDRIYGNSSFSYIDSILDLDGAGPELGAIDVSNKTQEEIAAVIEDIIYAEGSDDFMWVGYIMVTPQKPLPGSVTRDLPDAVSPGAEFSVSLTQSGFYFTGSVTETLPDGFSYEGVLSGGTLYGYDETTNDLTMDFQGGATTLIYKVKAGTAEQIKNAVFSGTWTTVDSQLNKISGSIGGETTLTLAEPTPTFDTGSGTYPSISGIHNGTITPSHNIGISRLFTYSCSGTGGHTEYVKIWNSTGWNVIATWNGYQGDWHNITFDQPVTLQAGTTYNYIIRTGSYPQIIHEPSFNALGGTITCTEFVDTNGKRYTWIPAIRLE